MQIIQVSLQSSGGKERLTTWVDLRRGLKNGALVTLKDFPGVIWEVDTVWPGAHEVNEFDWHREWTNNI